MNHVLKLKHHKVKSKYSTSIIKPLQRIVYLTNNKQVMSIIPLEEYFQGVKIKYNDGSNSYILCSNVEIGAIMWYYNIKNDKYTTLVNHDIKYHINKTLE